MAVVVVFFSKMNLTHRVKHFEECVIAVMSLLKTRRESTETLDGPELLLKCVFT